MSQMLATVFVLMLIGFNSCSQSSHAEDVDIVADLERLNQTWEQAWLDRNAALVERLMADEYVYIAPNGQMLDRQATLTIIRSLGYRLNNAARTDVVIDPVGRDAAVVVYRLQAEGVLEGKSFKDDDRCTMLCVQRGGEWQVKLEHCSPNNP